MLKSDPTKLIWSVTVTPTSHLKGFAGRYYPIVGASNLKPLPQKVLQLGLC